MARQPDQQTIRRILDDVEAVTRSRFYEDPEPYASPIEMFRMPEGKKGGEPFASLSVREKAQVLADYTAWRDYEQQGVGFAQLDQVFWNVIQGKPREEWLDGSGLDQPLLPGQKTPLEMLHEKAFQEMEQKLKAQGSATLQDQLFGPSQNSTRART
ncbi:MAG: hypothetical protein JO112_12775, partial [Planctomycetes bacterium]|nr:hypothetical protein [Planctomycetota bacterium]